MNTSADQQDAVQQFRDKLIQAQKQLGAELSSDAEVKQLSAFLDLLHDNAVPADLAMLEPTELKTLCQKMLEQIRQRQGELNVRFLPINSQNQGILVCSCNEAPFLLDSLLLLLRRERLCWQVITHLRLKITRSGTSIITLQDAKLERANESLLIVQSERAAGTEGMLDKIQQVLAAVLQVATDRDALYKTMKQLQPQADKAGYGSFWNWLVKDNFVPLSYRQLRPSNLESAPAAQTEAQTVEKTVLGIGADPAHNRLTLPHNYALCDMDTQACITQSNALAVTQSSKSSPVWRNEFLTYISLRGQNSAGENIVHDIAGLYTKHSRGSSSLEIDELRAKVKEAMLSLGIAPESYNYLKTKDLLSAFPITELFFLDQDQLQSIINSLLFSHPSSVRIVLLDHDSRRLNLLLIVPHSLNPSVDFPSIETYLKRQCNADVISSRVLNLDAEHFIVQVQLNGAQLNSTPNLPLLSERLTERMRSWEQKLRRELILLNGSTKGMELWQIYRRAFCINYRNRVSPRMCMNDINMLELLRADKGEQITMWRPQHSDSRCFLLFYNTQQDYLNELMPLLVNLDLTITDEVDFSVQLPEFKAYIKSFGVLNHLPAPADLFELKDALIETLRAMRAEQAENDYLNHLVVRAGLDWQQVDVFRAYHNYYFQLGSAFTKRTVAFALINNPRAAMALYRYFSARFKPEEKWADPMVREEEALHPARQELIESLSEVENVNDDSILRTMFNLIDSTVRTNFFIRRTQKDYFISLKISSIGIAKMPTPRPMYEVYVHNASMEGIHLRGGKVARGGIRWSDRPDDFRTEVLGLLKTQTTKNTLIVPMGSKGGFVVKTPFEDRNTGIELSKRAYQTFIRALLDLTDNREGAEIVTPKNLVCYDGEDPYLVVAADKGTALFSDTANAISAEYGYWLDDAFASGGSQGYDHKKLGITARGAWVNVKRHFREMGIDIQTEPFTVVGIGDMSGDVFGNAMLLSEQIKLYAAFNHRHIFIDPDPNP
ncbi:MAG: NAD-glutamate dehydrogenase, partial [Desulfuromonadaceae bacterium]|nr:NAD-glutamate dehydrogenase [Desulfuromonadaceae bacterium]